MHTLLFESIAAAKEAAFMLGAEWDGCSAITLRDVDEAALATVLNLVKSSCCKSGAFNYAIASAEDLIQLFASGYDLWGIKLQFSI